VTRSDPRPDGKIGRDAFAAICEAIREMDTSGIQRGHASHEPSLDRQYPMGADCGGRVACYAGQISDDRSSAFYGGAINVNRYNIWAAGGLVGYNFGPVSLNVWGLQELSSNASGGTAGAPGFDSAAITKGFSIFAQLNYRIWAPDAPASPTVPRIHK